MKTNKLKSGKRNLIICIIVVLTLACGVTYAAIKPDSVAKLFGKQQSEDAANNIVATIDGEKITKKGFDTYKLILNNGNKNEFTDKQVLGKILDRQVVYNQAIKEKISASDEDVSSAIKTSQEAIKADSNYKAFKEYVSGLNMTEDEYWESVKPVYKKAIICGKYKNSLKEIYKQENSTKDEKDLESKFEDFYKQKVTDLKSKAKVESNID